MKSEILILGHVSFESDLVGCLFAVSVHLYSFLPHDYDEWVIFSLYFNGVSDIDLTFGVCGSSFGPFYRVWFNWVYA